MPALFPAAFLLLLLGAGKPARAASPVAATPVFTPHADTYHKFVSVNLTDSTPGAVIHYALRGLVPTAKSTRYTGPIEVESTETIKAIAIAAGHANSAIASAKYIIAVLPAAVPEFSLPGGVYDAPRRVRIADATPGATIYYTTDKTIPTAASKKYSSPILVTDTETIKAVAFAAGTTESGVASAHYTILVDAAIPVFHPGGGSYSSPQNVKIADATPGAAIYYTTDGSTPSTRSARYTGPIAVPFSPRIQTLKAIAGGLDFKASEVASASYTITPLVATPVFFPAAGTYSDAVSVAITDTTENAAIHYTTNGKPPTPKSTKYVAPLDVAESESIQAIAVANGNQPSAIGSARYDISSGVTAPAVISAVPALNGAVVVSLSTTTSGATIYYTLDGTAPTASSTVYEAPFLIDSTLTLNAFAVASIDSNSPETTHQFTTQIPAGTLVWSDEFGNTTGQSAQPNPLVWTYDTGNSGFGNKELENYCAWGSNNPPCSVADPNAYVGTDGYLHIVALSPSTNVYTSARLKTQGLFSFRYGRIEFRAKVPEAQSFWPAAWLLGNNIATVDWPACGEQDDLERVNAATAPDWNEGSIHGASFTGGNLGTKYDFPAGQTAADWHTYGMIWSPGQVSYYIDDPTKPYATYTPSSLNGLPGAMWPFDEGQSNFIILNLAVGGNWPGPPDSTTPFPSEFLVDYVRIYTD
ncbi:MAG: chitobiase/beta-hexosaminidase C-terminal domain-containing protein [Terracidiphilus sp.]